MRRRAGRGRLLGLGLVLALPLLAAGCGYHTLGQGAVLPPRTRTVAILPFANHTRQPQISQAISAAVARAFLTRTHYRVQPTAPGSDVAVHGDVLSVEINPVTFDAASGRATTVEVVVHLAAWVSDSASGKELYRNNDLVFHDQYQISTQQRDFFEEDSTAFQRLSRSVGETLTADILEAF